MIRFTTRSLIPDIHGITAERAAASRLGQSAPRSRASRSRQTPNAMRIGCMPKGLGAGYVVASPLLAEEECKCRRLYSSQLA